MDKLRITVRQPIVKDAKAAEERLVTWMEQKRLEGWSEEKIKEELLRLDQRARRV